MDTADKAAKRSMSAETAPTAQSRRDASLDRGATFSRTLLNVGFAFALLISAACLLMSGFYLFKFLNTTSASIESVIGNVSPNAYRETLPIVVNSRLVMARIGLLSCGVLVGLSFGFLGFGLFLLGIRKEMEVGASYENYQLKLARVSPGVLVILCATILIGVCVTHTTPFSYNMAETRPAPTQADDNSERDDGQTDAEPPKFGLPTPVDEPSPTPAR